MQFQIDSFKEKFKEIMSMRIVYRNVKGRKKRDASKAFESANSMDERLKTFKKMEKLFPESELGFGCFKLTNELITQRASPEQVLSFGNRALRIFISNDNANIPCFGTTYSEISTGTENDGTLCTRYHKPSLYIAMVCRMLAFACCELERYNESLSYLNWANRNMNMLLEDNTSSCGGKCVLRESVHTQQILCWLNMEMGRFEEALSICLKALELQTKHFGNSSVVVAELMNDLACIYDELEEHEKALEQIQLSQSIFKNMAPDSPDFFEGEFVTGIILIGLGRYEEAVDILNRVVSHEHVRGIAFVNLSKALFYSGKCAKAKKHMKTAQRILEKKDALPNHVADGLYEMSMLYEKMNDLGKATSLLRRALSFPKIPHKVLAEGSTRLFSLISLAGKEEEGIPYMEDVVEKLKAEFGAEDCKVGHGYKNLGVAYLKLGREELAVKFLTKAKHIMDSKLGPDHLDSLKTNQILAETYATMRSYIPAIEIQAKVVDSLKVLEPPEQEFLDTAVKLLNKMKESVAESSMQASLWSKDVEDFPVKI